MESQRDGGRREHLAADRKDAVHLAQALLEVTALDRRHRRDQDVANRVAADRPAAGRGGIGRAAREAILEQLAHQRLGIGERGDAASDVPDRRDAQLLAQDPGRAAVVGDRDDRGQVARVLLEPAQQRREPRPAADRDDPRPAREKSLLVDQLDEGAAFGRAEGIRQGPGRAIHPDHDQRYAGDDGQQAAQRVGQELKGYRVDDRLGDPARLEIATRLADDVGHAEGEQEETREHHEEPALHADAGRQPAAEVHARSSSR